MLVHLYFIFVIIRMIFWDSGFQVTRIHIVEGFFFLTCFLFWALWGWELVIWEGECFSMPTETDWGHHLMQSLSFSICNHKNNVLTQPGVWTAWHRSWAARTTWRCVSSFWKVKFKLKTTGTICSLVSSPQRAAFRSGRRQFISRVDWWVGKQPWLFVHFAFHAASSAWPLRIREPWKAKKTPCSGLFPRPLHSGGKRGWIGMEGEILQEPSRLDKTLI